MACTVCSSRGEMIPCGLVPKIVHQDTYRSCLPNGGMIYDLVASRVVCKAPATLSRRPGRELRAKDNWSVSQFHACCFCDVLS